jgi:hypothetical protein
MSGQICGRLSHLFTSHFRDNYKNPSFKIPPPFLPTFFYVAS